jgi:MFS family permease
MSDLEKKQEGNSPASSYERPLISNFRQIMLSSYWFSNGFLWSALMSVAMPYQIQKAVGDDGKGAALGLVTAVGAFLSLFAAPIFGTLSDRIQLPYGRRKPWLLIGNALMIVSLLGCAFFIKEGDSGSVYLFGVAYALVVLFSNMATAPYSAMMPDNIADEQQGSVSGWLGIMMLLGNLTGGLTGFLINSLTIQGVYYAIIAILAFGTVCVLFGMEEVQKKVNPVGTLTVRQFMIGLVQPLKNRAFVWVLLVRMFVKLGQSLVGQFMQFYMDDVIKPGNYLFAGMEVAKIAAEAVGVFQGGLLFGGALVTLIAGKVSGRVGNKPLVFLACILMSIVSLVVMFLTNFTVVVLMGIVFGFGFGAYTGVDFSLVQAVLPSKDDYAKDMGVWHTTDVIPQIIAGSVGGVLLDAFKVVGKNMGDANLGYKAVFSISILSFAVAALFARKLHN